MALLAAALLAAMLAVAPSARLQQRAPKAVPDASPAVAEEEKPLVALIVGGPGSGKGTQCANVADTFGYAHLGAGDLLRAERTREGSPLGEMIDRLMRAGGAVPSEVIAQLLEQAMLVNGSSDSRYLIDGYPRSVDQLRGWDTSLKHKVRLVLCVHLKVSREEMRRRLLSRGESSGRIDDNLEVIEKRLDQAEAETAPVLEYFEKAGVLRTLDGGRPPCEVWKEVMELFAKAEAGAYSKTEEALDALFHRKQAAYEARQERLKKQVEEEEADPLKPISDAQFALNYGDKTDNEYGAFGDYLDYFRSKTRFLALVAAKEAAAGGGEEAVAKAVAETVQSFSPVDMEPEEEDASSVKRMYDQVMDNRWADDEWFEATDKLDTDQMLAALDKLLAELVAK